VEAKKPADDSEVPGRNAGGAADDAGSQPPRAVEEPADPREIRLHLMDGSVLAGQLSVDEISVATDFGKLTVPVTKIRSFHPGLDSYPQLSKKISELIDNLGSDDYQAREQAHKDLVNWGLKVRSELERRVQDDNAERKRHLTEILKEFDELAEEQLDDYESDQDDRPWIRGDKVVTDQFTIVGKIVEDSFQIRSKYGSLTVQLSDVVMADKPVSLKQEILKTVTVDGSNLVQRSFKASGIQVERGDKVMIRAEGQIGMTPWGSEHQSTPDGGQYYGWYVPNEIPGGALIAKLGNNGKVFKVGTRHTFVAQAAGTLQFAVAMQHQYANQGYNYPGQYTVRVKVEPK
jgi:hypothetical protein